MSWCDQRAGSVRITYGSSGGSKQAVGFPNVTFQRLSLGDEGVGIRYRGTRDKVQVEEVGEIKKL